MLNAWKPVLVVSSLLLALTYLWLKSTSPELEHRNRLQENLRVIELREAELMRDILLARAGLLPNYDALTLAGHDLVRLSNSLKAQTRPIGSETGQSLINSADALAAVLQDKLEKVEYFKSDNALLRNSVMYFNLAGKNLSPDVKTSRLWQAMFSFMAAPDSDLAQNIQGELDSLSRLKSLPKNYRTLLAHGRLIVKELPKLDGLLHDIINTPITAHVDDFQITLNNYGSEVEARAQAHRLWLYLVAVVLVGYVIYQFLRLRKYTLDLSRAHSHLQQETVERQQAEVALRDSEEQLRAITESAHEAIVSVNSQGTIMSWNQGATVMFGYTCGDALAMALVRVLPKLTPEQASFLAGGHSLSNLNRAAIEWLGRRQDGSEFPLELSLSIWTCGEKVYTTAIIRDISTRKQLEETARQQELKLIQANKMTALGTLVSGVAHEINNPNQLILMNASLLADSWGDAQEVLDDHAQRAGDFFLGGLPYSEMRKALPVLIHDIKDGALRIERIVADLKHFARPQLAHTPVRFSLNEVVECAVRLLNHLINRKTTHFTTQLADDLPMLSGDPQQVEQVVVNLLVNALEALPNADCAVCVATFGMKGKTEVYLEVRDEGCGIDPSHLEQLCDPFFTTKQGSGGTGLGLAITASLVRAHAGLLSFSSTPGKGTVARIVFSEPSP